MSFDLPTILALLPILATIVLGFLQYRLNSKVDKSNASRVPSQNQSDTASAFKSYAEANAILGKDLAEERLTVADLEKRIKELELMVSKQKVRVVLDLYLGEKPRIDSSFIERIVTGQLKEKAV